MVKRVEPKERASNWEAVPGLRPPAQLLEMMRAAGHGVAAHVLDAKTRDDEERNARVRCAMNGAIDAVSLVFAKALDGDPGARATLERVSEVARPIESRYLATEDLCSAWLAGERVSIHVVHAGPRTTREQARATELLCTLRDRVDYAFGDLREDDVAKAASTAKDGAALAAHLIVAANAIKPRPRGVLAEKHAKDIRKALSAAKSKKSVQSATRGR